MVRTGQVGLLDLFEGRRQLVMHHFMWTYDIDADGSEHPREVGCPSCSATADAIGDLTHLHVRNTTLAAASRAPYANIAAFRAANGLDVPLVLVVRAATSTTTSTRHSMTGSRRCCSTSATRPSSNASATPGRRRCAGTGRASARSCATATPSTTRTRRSPVASSLSGSTSYYLDLTALGRQEAWEEPKGRTSALGMQAGGPDLRFHDEYGPEDGA